jgi:transposase
MLEETKTASVSSVARKHGIAKSLLFRWRRDAGLEGKKAKRSAEQFLPVVMQQKAAASFAPRMRSPDGMIEIELASGHKLRITGHVHADALKQAIAALGG